MPVVAKRSSGSSTQVADDGGVVWLSAAICLLLKVVAVAGERTRLHAALANPVGSGERDWSDSPPRCRALGPGARPVKGAGVVGASGLRQLGFGVAAAAVTSGLGRLFGTVVG